MKIFIYVIDPDPTQQHRIVNAVTPEAEAVLPFSSAEAFLESMPLRTPALLIAAAALPGMGVPQLIRELRRAAVELPVIAIGVDADVQAAVELMRAGAADFIERPVSARQLRNAVRKLVSRDK